jgi:hypothetical protein
VDKGKSSIGRACRFSNEQGVQSDCDAQAAGRDLDISNAYEFRHRDFLQEIGKESLLP